MNTNKNKKVFKYAAIGGITAASLAGAAANAIIGYVAVYFFAPVWKKVATVWEKKEQKINEQNTN